MVKLPELPAFFRRSQSKLNRMPMTAHNLRHRLGAKLLIISAIVGFIALVLNRSSQVREAVTLWHDRAWFIAFMKAVSLPPWLEFVLMVVCAGLCLLAIYELHNRPPVVLTVERGFVVGLRSLDLNLGRIDLEITPEELMERFNLQTGETGLEADEHKQEFLHKFLFAAGTFLDVYRESGFYSVHMNCGPGLIFARMNTMDTHEHLEKLRKGDQISLRGKITYIGHQNICLENAEFAGSRRLVSENYAVERDSTIIPE